MWTVWLVDLRQAETRLTRHNGLVGVCTYLAHVVFKVEGLQHFANSAGTPEVKWPFVASSGGPAQLIYYAIAAQYYFQENSI